MTTIATENEMLRFAQRDTRAGASIKIWWFRVE
jgi:hypothetical protein